MKRIFLPFAFLILISCNKENKTNYNIKNKDSVSRETVLDTSKEITIGYYYTYEKLPKLVVDSISETEFNLLKTTKYLENIEPEQSGDFFFIQTEHKKYKFRKYKNYAIKENRSASELLGYYTNLKLFAIADSSTSEYLGFGKLFLLDYTNDYQYNILPFVGGNVMLPIPSVNNKYFVYYYNPVYESQNCQIGVLKINDKTNPKKYLTEAASYESDNFKIEKIIWKTDQVFFIKGYKEVENKNLYSYYKAEIK